MKAKVPGFVQLVITRLEMGLTLAFAVLVADVVFVALFDLVVLGFGFVVVACLVVVVVLDFLAFVVGVACFLVVAVCFAARTRSIRVGSRTEDAETRREAAIANKTKILVR